MVSAKYADFGDVYVGTLVPDGNLAGLLETIAGRPSYGPSTRTQRLGAMLSMIRWLVLRFAALRWLFKLGGLGFLIPIALLLKTVGLPILAILSVIGLPILALLFMFGLPVILVLVFGGMLMGLIGMVLAIGVTVLKFALLVGVPVWLTVQVVRWVKRRNCGWDDDSDSHAPPPPPAPSPASADAPVTPSDAAAAAEPVMPPTPDAPDNPPGWEPA